MDLEFFSGYLQPRELAQGRVALVCRSWLHTHRALAWKHMVLTAGSADEIQPFSTPADAHATVQSFLSAPNGVLEWATLSAESLTLLISESEDFLDHNEKWMRLSFHRLSRLVIKGPNHVQNGRSLALSGLDGLRFAGMLSKLNQTVHTLILDAAVSNLEDRNCQECMTAIVCLFPKLRTLDIPWPAKPLFLGPQQLCLLECCRGLGVDLQNLGQSWMAHAAHLKQLHIEIYDRHRHWHPACLRADYDCGVLFRFLHAKCPEINFLSIVLREYGSVKAEHFDYIPASIKYLVLSLDDVVVEGLDYEEEYYPKDYEAEIICPMLRKWVPDSCKLYVLKRLWILDMEDPVSFITAADRAASA